MNPDIKGRHFTYYTFDEHYRPEFLDRWEIIGLHQQSTDPWLLDMRCMHIEMEDIENIELFAERKYKALEDARSYLSLNPATLSALITFLKDRVFEWNETNQNITLFHRLKEVDLEHMRFPFWKIPDLRKAGYRYVPGEDVQRKEEITLFSFPVWNAQYGANQSSSFEYDSFHEKRLNDPSFVPFASFRTTQSVSTFTLNQRALQELIVLLEQHSYEAFVKGLKHGPAIST